MKKALRYSILIHITFFALLFLAGAKGCGTGSGNSRTSNAGQEESKLAGNDKASKETMTIEMGDILPKPSKDKELVEQPKPSDKDGIVKEDQTPADDECPDSYGGIGCMWSGQMVDSVMPGYPAARAGIQRGDYPLESYSEVRGEIGTAVTLHVYRNGELLEFHMVREKICISKRPH